jgi:Arc/MetJ family transcription regulator
MRATIEIPDALMREALRVSKAKTKTTAIVLGLQELIRRHRLQQLRLVRR